VARSSGILAGSAFENKLSNELDFVGSFSMGDR